jgi:hypothetical protein
VEAVAALTLTLVGGGERSLEWCSAAWVSERADDLLLVSMGQYEQPVKFAGWAGGGEWWQPRLRIEVHRPVIAGLSKRIMLNGINLVVPFGPNPVSVGQSNWR